MLGVERLPCPWPFGNANACLAHSGPVVFSGSRELPVEGPFLPFLTVPGICLFRVAETGHLLTISVALSRFRVSQRGRGNPSGQRSFNWQSTAFVMRGLRVRLPPLALVAGGGACFKHARWKVECYCLTSDYEALLKRRRSFWTSMR